MQRVILLVDTAKAGAWNLESGCCVTRCPAERRRRSQGKPRSWNRRQPVRLRRRILRLHNQGKPPDQAEHRAALQVPTVTIFKIILWRVTKTTQGIFRPKAPAVGFLQKSGLTVFMEESLRLKDFTS